MDGSGQQSAVFPVLLIVSFEQFGYHIDTFEYCRYLCDRYRITYLCLDHYLPRKEIPGVDVVYCQRRPFGKLEIGLWLDASAAIHRILPDLVFLRRTKFSFLLRLGHPLTPMIFDVRSGSVETSVGRRCTENFILRFNSWFFRHITVISEGLKRQLRLPGRARVLPLAGDRQLSLTSAPKDELRLVYIGTFKNRHLERTVDGLGRFLAAADSGTAVRYSIVGFGSKAESSTIRKAVFEHALEAVVEIHERVDHEGVPELLSTHNVGVAFTPRVPWFENQPSTKIFEYLHSGLLCIATDSAANRDVISGVNGVLIGDSADAFAQGLHRIRELLPGWDPQTVADCVRENTWERVVRDTLAPLMETVRR